MRINAQGGELVLRNEHGDTIIVPRERRKEAMSALLKDDHRAIDSLALQLPKASRYAAKGTVLGGQDPGNGLTRPDGTKKGKGFYGNLPNKNGNISSELSISSSDVEEGKEVLIPTLIPGLSRKEIDYLLSNKYNPQSRVGIDNIISRKAIDFARKRKQQGFPYFAHEIEEGAFKYASGGNIKPDPPVEGIMGPETTITAPRPEKSIGNFFQRWGHEHSENPTFGKDSFLGAIGSGIMSLAQLPQAAATYMLDPKGNVLPSKALQGTQTQKDIEISAAQGNIGAKILKRPIVQDMLLDPLLLTSEIAKGVSKGSELINGLKKSELINDLGNKYLPNTYKINPWAFKPNPEAYYRVLGKEGLNDALESGVIRANPKNIHPFSGEPIYDRPYFSKGVPFDRDWKSPFKNKKGKQVTGSIYPDETMVEVLGHDRFHKTGDLVTSPTDILNSFDEGINFYKRDWLKGYEKVPKSKSTSSFKSEIDWSKWNKEIPENKALMQEYNVIEQQTKANGTWMKNPDGSVFQGTPEQFIQQNSENFKKAFGNSKLVNPDGSPIFLYHGSAKKFDIFDPSKFQLGDAGSSGSGIYTVPNKRIADSYALSSSSIHSGNKIPTVYQLYGKGVNPISSEEIIKNTGAGYPNRFESNQAVDLFNFHRKSAPKHEQLLDYDVAIHNQQRGIEKIRDWNDAWEIVFPTNKQLKSAIGNNGMFDMTNPNIFKALAPTIIAGALANKNKN